LLFAAAATHVQMLLLLLLQPKLRIRAAGVTLVLLLLLLPQHMPLLKQGLTVGVAALHSAMARCLASCATAEQLARLLLLRKVL
jgi:hypothetical protein